MANPARTDDVSRTRWLAPAADAPDEQLAPLRDSPRLRAMAVVAAGGGSAADELLAGKYRVEGTVHSGERTLVVSAWHVDLDKRVAIKFHPRRPHCREHGGRPARSAPPGLALAFERNLVGGNSRGRLPPRALRRAPLSRPSARRAWGTSLALLPSLAGGGRTGARRACSLKTSPNEIRGRASWLT
jgi:hypothetical protein